jgi:hypothetical protein
MDGWVGGCGCGWVCTTRELLDGPESHACLAEHLIILLHLHCSYIPAGGGDPTKSCKSWASSYKLARLHRLRTSELGHDAEGHHSSSFTKDLPEGIKGVLPKVLQNMPVSTR